MATTSTAPGQQKGSAPKIQVPSPDIIKMCKKGMSGVDLINLRAADYQLDLKSNNMFCLRIFFDLMDVACANSHIIYNMIHPNDLSQRNFKIIDSSYLI